MVANKNYYKSKMQEKKLEILRAIIEEEIEYVYSELLLEQEPEGFSRLTNRNVSLPGMIGSIGGDLVNAFKVFGARVGTTLVGMAGFLISATIASLLPFNDPRTVQWLGAKFKNWEQQNMKIIDKQFETELGNMKQGWDRVKGDYWGIGFVCAPLGAVAAIATVATGVDMGFSVLNVATGGWAEQKLDKIIGDVEDPGDLKSYLQAGQEKDEKKAEDHGRKAVEGERCFSRLQDQGYVDPECIGATQRDNFPAGPQGTSAFINFVSKNVRNFNNTRGERFSQEYPNSGQEYKHVWDNSDSDPKIIGWLKTSGYIQESAEQLEEGFGSAIAGAFGKAKSALGFAAAHPPTGLPALDKLNAKLGEWVGQKKITQADADAARQKIMKELLDDPEAKSTSAAWSAKKVGYLVGETAKAVNKELPAAQGSGQVSISPQEAAKYAKALPSIMQKALEKSAAGNKKFKVVIPQEVKSAVLTAVAAAAPPRLPPAVRPQGQKVAPQAPAKPPVAPPSAAPVAVPPAAPAPVAPAPVAPAAK